MLIAVTCAPVRQPCFQSASSTVTQGWEKRGCQGCVLDHGFDVRNLLAGWCGVHCRLQRLELGRAGILAVSRSQSLQVLEQLRKTIIVNDVVDAVLFNCRCG